MGPLSFMKGIWLVPDLEATVNHKEGAHTPPPPQTATVPIG